MSTDRLLHYIEHAKKGAERNRLTLREIEEVLVQRNNSSEVENSPMLSVSHSRLSSKAVSELLAWKNVSLEQLERYEQALRTQCP
jgi:hypothetical protein